MNSSTISCAISRILSGNSVTISFTHETKSFKFILHASARFIPPNRVSRAFEFNLVPPQSLQTVVVKNLLILVNPFSVFAFLKASSIAL